MEDHSHDEEETMLHVPLPSVTDRSKPQVFDAAAVVNAYKPTNRLVKCEASGRNELHEVLDVVVTPSRLMFIDMRRQSVLPGGALSKSKNPAQVRVARKFKLFGRNFHLRSIACHRGHSVGGGHHYGVGNIHGPESAMVLLDDAYIGRDAVDLNHLSFQKDVCMLVVSREDFAVEPVLRARAPVTPYEDIFRNACDIGEHLGGRVGAMLRLHDTSPKLHNVLRGPVSILDVNEPVDARVRAVIVVQYGLGHARCCRVVSAMCICVILACDLLAGGFRMRCGTRRRSSERYVVRAWTVVHSARNGLRREHRGSSGREECACMRCFYRRDRRHLVRCCGRPTGVGCCINLRHHDNRSYGSKRSC